MSAVLDHLWQSTLFALGLGLLTTAFRKARASIRYGLWFAASAKFLVPFAVLAALGRLLAPAIRPPAPATPGAVFIEQAAQPFSHAHTAAPAAHATAPLVHAMAPMTHAAVALDPALVLLAVWALGCAALLVFWMTRWATVRSAVRQATVLALPAPMPILASSWTREPGLVGLWRPVLMVPDGLFDHLTGPESDALIAHESCHLRRRDNLTAAIHMLAEALFWFHPLVWWIGARLIEERERACDEAVVQSGHDRAAYARSLVECCRLYLQSSLPCVAGAAGSYLMRRVEAIMTAPPCRPLSRAGKALLLAAGVCAVATPVAAGWLTSPAGRRAAARVVASAGAAEPVGIAVARLARIASTVTASPVRSGRPETAAVAQDEALSTSAPEATAAGETSPSVAIEPVSQMSVTPVANVKVAQLSMPTASLGSGVTLAAFAAADAPSPAGSPPWCRVPTRPEMDRVYPMAADRNALPGSATLICRIYSDRLSSCRIESEEPGGLGFGRAALFLSDLFRIPVIAGYGGSGREVRVRVDFTPPRRAVLEPRGPDGRSFRGRNVAFWDRGPQVDFAKYRPSRAEDELRGGQVMLRCRVQPTGALADCAVASETPTGWGFARAALESVRDLKLSRTAVDGSPTAGRVVEVPLVFNAPCVPEGARTGPPG